MIRTMTETEHLGGEQAADARRWEATLARVEALRLLQDDWDGEGAESPAASVVDEALRLLDTIRSLQSACPSTVGAVRDGSVMLAWEQADRYFEIEVGMDHLSWLRSAPGVPAAGGASEADALRGLADWLRS